MNYSKQKYEVPSEFAESIGLEYSRNTSDNYKKENGQYFTPKVIADFMSSIASHKSNRISILDPGCGTGVLSCSLIEELVSKTDILEIELELYETDENVISKTMVVIKYLSSWLEKRNIKLHYEINQKDFIIDNSSVFSLSTLFETKKIKKFDYIISNPPYFKISKNDKRATLANELIYGQPNIYSLFMGLSAKLLNKDGEMIFITPRSFAAGSYFKAFRQSFFNEVSISNLHIFESRKKMFRNNNVLQENIIIRATKAINKTIKITVSESDNDLNTSKEKLFETDTLIDLKSKNKILFIPSNENEAKTIEIFKNWHNSLNDYNIKISTGPIVAFRCTDFLKMQGSINDTYIPLIWMHNIKEMEFAYPLQKGNKPSIIVYSNESRKVMLRNKNYVLIRRFSSKDDKKRLVSCPYFSSYFNTDMIGIENHVNYIHRPDGNLSDYEIVGISALYNSNLFDTYFRTFNGNTQVGANELKQIKLPPIKDIVSIGRKIMELINPKKSIVEKIVNQVLMEDHYVKDFRSTDNSKRFGFAKASTK